MEKGTLYIVATPIGNLEDITLRAIKTLQDADLIAAEDTRHTLKLLNHLEISKPMISYHRHNEETKSDVLIEKLQEGQNIALVSDAGTPGICDPGEVVIKKCIEEEIKVVPVPGACAFVNALICSGLNTDGFLFLGFLPLNKKNRKQKLDKICNSTETVIIYEAPHKLQSTLLDLKNVIGNRRVVLARELTKIHEEFLSGSIEEYNCSYENVFIPSQIDNVKITKIENGAFKNNMLKSVDIPETVEEIKTNAYIENAKISRKIPNKIEINIEEREATYNVEFLNGYAYINNQGYILEVSQEKLDLPVIQGIKTSEEKIVAGNRLEKEDLEKLETVISITNIWKNNDIEQKITSIDITNKLEYTLYVEEEKQKIYLGDESNLNNKILWVQAIMKDNKGIEGEIYVNGDLNDKFKPRFKQKV